MSDTPDDRASPVEGIGRIRGADAERIFRRAVEAGHFDDLRAEWRLAIATSYNRNVRDVALDLGARLRDLLGVERLDEVTADLIYEEALLRAPDTDWPRQASLSSPPLSAADPRVERRFGLRREDGGLPGLARSSRS
jgi:hypothetical protein